MSLLLYKWHLRWRFKKWECCLSTWLQFRVCTRHDACKAHSWLPKLFRENLSLATNYSCMPWNFPLKCDGRTTSGCSPEAVFLSHVNKLVRVWVWGAVVMRSLHVSALSSLDGLTDGWIDDRFGGSCQPLSLLRGGHTLTTVSPLNGALSLCAPHSVSLTYTSLVVLSYFLSLALVCPCCFFVYLLSFPLWLSSATWSTPKGPWQLRKFTSCFSLSLYHCHPIIVSCSLFHCYFSPGSLCLSQPPNDKVGLWQLGKGCQFWLRHFFFSLLPPFNLAFPGLSPSFPTPPTPSFHPYAQSSSVN